MRSGCDAVRSDFFRVIPIYHVKCLFAMLFSRWRRIIVGSEIAL
jgi:hypothetical protein